MWYNAAPLFVRKECVRALRAKMYLQELEELAVAVEQDEELKQGYLDRAQKIEIQQCAGLALNAEKEANESTEKYELRKKVVIDQIISLHNIRYSRVLFKVYVQFKSFKVVATEMSISYQYARKLHKQALVEFEERYTNMLNEWEKGRCSN